MKILPAIDLKGGCCVRLLKGEMNTAKIFSDNPAEQALEFLNAGCDFIHVVDLDGAFAGKSMNEDAVASIITALDKRAKVELGGGIRSFETIEKWLSQGIDRVILGTIAVKNPDFVISACKEFKGKIAVGIDARNGMVAVEGWAESSDIKAYDLAMKFEDAGVSAIIHTDIDRDGLLTGPNLEETIKLAKKISIPVIVSGGISSLEDVIACKNAADKLKKPSCIEGVITGRAVYDGRIDLKKAVAVLQKGSI